jgi:peptidoglycan/xylan/chitin deacetylase (PgdA/CDA1 family)
MISMITGRRLVTRLPSRSQTLYLTFDDGPDPRETPLLLELLAQFDIKATFFMVGRTAERQPQIVKAVADDGHTLANHSMTHPWFNRLSMRQQIWEIESADKELDRCDGILRHPCRPPQGKWTVFALVACLARSQKLVLWSHDSLDYRLPAADVVAHLRSRAIRSGDIFLFHDDGPVARETLRQLVPEWKMAGFGFSAL